MSLYQPHARTFVFIASVATCLVSVVFFAAPPARADRVDDFVAEQMRRQRIPGLSLAVVRHGKTVKVRGYGLADVERRAPATGGSVYKIASVTKQFTAAAVLMLAGEGKLRLDDHIAAHLPGTPAAWAGITVRHLLDHTSGLPNYTALPGHRQRSAAPVTHAELFRQVTEPPLDFAPGTKWAYSNTNYYLLGMVIEKVSGKPYSDFLRERIFVPLGMDATRVGDDRTIVPGRADGYTLDGAELVRPDPVSMTWPFAAGAMLSSATDMAKWAVALDRDRLLTGSQRDAMWTGGRLQDGTPHGYGFGWFVGSVRGHRNQSHGGGIPGFTSHVSRFPEAGCTVVVLANREDIDPVVISNGVARRMATELTHTSGGVMPVTAEDRKRIAQVRSIFERAARGRADAGLFTSAAAASVTERLIGLRPVLERFGPLRSVTLIERGGDTARRSHRYRVAYDDASALVSVAVTADGKILSLDVSPE